MSEAPLIHRSPWADIEVPDVALPELVFSHLFEEQNTAFEHAETGAVVTFGQVKHDTDAVATWLDGQGTSVGDVVAIDLTNCPEYAAAFHGTLVTGAAVTPINPAAVPAEIARQLRATGAKFLVTNATLLPRVAEAAASVGLPASSVIVIDPGSDDGAHTHWAELIGTEPDPPEGRVSDPATHVACLPTSSGTSGLPKAVMLSHRNLVANLLQFDQVLRALGDDNSLVAFLPYSHIYGLTTNLNYGLFRRFTQYTMSSFQPQLFLQIVATLAPTMLFVVPPVATFLARHPAIEQVPWTSVRLVISGAAPLDGPIGAAIEKRLDTRLIQGYGMTELSPVSHVIPVDRRDIDPGTIGPAIPNVTFRVVDPETGADVPRPAEGEWSASGELWVSGPNTMLGYLGVPVDTDAVLDSGGWVHTGDLVQVDSEGVVRVVDRIKELIKRRGFQVPPAELEALLCTHPDVTDAAVLGVGHASGDQVPHALVVLREGAEAEPRAIVHWANAQVASYKRIGSATVIEAVPRSAAGKILRRQLPALLD